MKLSDLNGNFQVISSPSQSSFSIDQRGTMPKKLSDINQSQAALAQSQSTLDTIRKTAFQSPLQNIASGNPGNNVEVAKGALKQGVSDLSMAGAQNAGPVGAAMLKNAPAFAGKINSFNQAVKPSNPLQSQGAMSTSIAEGAIPMGAAKSTGVFSKISEATGLSKYLSGRATKKATEALQSTAETMTKGEREAAISEGRLKPTSTGGGKYEASQTEQRAGEILSNKIGKNPVKNVPTIQNEIATRGKEAETYLEKNIQKISNEEDFSAFAKKRAEIEKYSTPAELNKYDETINLFQKVLKSRGEYNTANYYKALKEFESNVTRNIPKGKEALLVEGGSARLQAAKDVRSVVRDMIKGKNPEFGPQMYDLASLYDSLDNVIAKAEQINKSGLKEFAKRHPYITGAATFAGGEAALKKARDWTGL